MAASLPGETALLNLPLEILTGVCQQLDVRDLVRVAAACRRLRHGDSGLELPTKSPVVTALRDHAFPGGSQIPSTRPIGCFESWVAYLAGCARHRRCRDAPALAAGRWQSLFIDAAGQLLTCGQGTAAGQDCEKAVVIPTPVAAMAGLRVRSVAAGSYHSLVIGWDGRVYSWGQNGFRQLGHGDKRTRALPALVEGFDGVRGVAAAAGHSLAVTQSGGVLTWGESFQPAVQHSVRPSVVEGFGAVRVSRVCAGLGTAFAIGEMGQLFSWGDGCCWRLGHGDMQHRPAPKRVEALQGVQVSSVSVGRYHALALAEDGLVYAWGKHKDGVLLGKLNVESEPMPRPVEALRNVRVGSIAVAGERSYALADTGELWAWGCERDGATPLGHGDEMDCLLPKQIEALPGIKVDAVVAQDHATLALADDGSVYAWGDHTAAKTGALGLGRPVSDAGRAERAVHTPQRFPALRVTSGL
jgi:alpha-tubulin suppressor-like RCC1 family protein